jgi:two-component system, sensor histidine kinase and response regulator
MDNFILVIDDNAENLKVLGNILKENGYKIALVQSGKEAFSICESITPMLIFLDVMMPEMDGYEVLSKFKSVAETRDIPIIMVTAKNEAEDIDAALELGAVDYIKKPINKIELLARMRTTIKLREKEIALQEMLKSKEEFIQIVAHDLRTPFASISGFADILMNDTELNAKMKTEHKEYLKLIIDSSAFLVDYFNKLLNWASIEANGLQVRKVQVNLKNIIQTAQLLYTTKLSEKNLNFYNSIDDNALIEADSSLFQQIVNNILSNAIKFTPENGDISVLIENDTDNLTLIVRDSGIGIDKLTPAELFGKSFHKSTRGTNGEKGTGIGLHICKVIADAHAFGLTFRPAPNKGTDFVISIPQDKLGG